MKESASMMHLHPQRRIRNIFVPNEWLVKMFDGMEFVKGVEVKDLIEREILKKHPNCQIIQVFTNIDLDGSTVQIYDESFEVVYSGCHIPREFIDRLTLEEEHEIWVAWRREKEERRKPKYVPPPTGRG